MRILFITYGTHKAPATRYRTIQYLPYLEKEGIEYKVFSVISKFSTNLMIASPDFHPLLQVIYYVYVFAERFFRLLGIIYAAKRFDIIFLQRVTFPFRLENLLKRINRNIIFDIDDAIYLPDKDGYDFITRLKKYMKESEVVNILKASRAVIVENEYIKKFVQQYCENIIKIPGPIDTTRFAARSKTKSSDDIVIGWTGSPATTAYLHILDNVFNKIAEKYPFVKFKFIGAGNYNNPRFKYEKLKWSYDTEIKDLQSFDIGIMPMPDDKWTRGKLGCKMLQYMALGIPVALSFTSTNAEIVEDKENGFFATGESEWIKILSMLIENDNLRKTIGERGRQTILDKCSLSHHVNTLVELFEKLNT